MYNLFFYQGLFETFDSGKGTISPMASFIYQIYNGILSYNLLHAFAIFMFFLIFVTYLRNYIVNTKSKSRERFVAEHIDESVCDFLNSMSNPKNKDIYFSGLNDILSKGGISAFTPENYHLLVSEEYIQTAKKLCSENLLKKTPSLREVLLIPPIFFGYMIGYYFISSSFIYLFTTGLNLPFSNYVLMALVVSPVPIYAIVMIYSKMYYSNYESKVRSFRIVLFSILVAFIGTLFIVKYNTNKLTVEYIKTSQPERNTAFKIRNVSKDVDVKDGTYSTDKFREMFGDLIYTLTPSPVNSVLKIKTNGKLKDLGNIASIDDISSFELYAIYTEKPKTKKPENVDSKKDMFPEAYSKIYEEEEKYGPVNSFVIKRIFKLKGSENGSGSLLPPVTPA